MPTLALPNLLHTRQPREMHEHIKPQVLVAFGLVANALFWSGLLLPFNAKGAPEIAYLHVFVVLLGLALAFGGTMATLMIVARKASVPVRSTEYAAGMLNISVLTAVAFLLLSKLILSM